MFQRTPAQEMPSKKLPAPPVLPATAGTASHGSCEAGAARVRRGHHRRARARTVSGYWILSETSPKPSFSADWARSTGPARPATGKDGLNGPCEDADAVAERARARFQDTGF